MDLIDAVPQPPEAKKFVPFEEALEKVKAIAVRVKEEAKRRNLEMAMESRRLAGEDGLPKPRMTIEMLIPGSKMSDLLGAQGENLKRIERMTNTKIQVDQNFSNINEERKIVLTGTHDELSRAKELIKEKTDESMAGKSFGNVVYLAIPAAKVGLVIGKQGQTIHDLQTASGARVAVLPNNDPMAVERTIIISGEEDCIKRAKELIHDVMYGIGTTLKLAGKNTMTLTIPDHTIGLLIGKKGEYLKQMQEMSKAEIFIESIPSNSNPNLRNVHISGTPDAMNYAQELVMSKVAAALKREGKEDDYVYDMGSYDFVKPSEASMQPSMQMYDPASYDPAAYAAYYHQYYQAFMAHYDPTNPEHQAFYNYYHQYFGNQQQQQQNQ